ncbi:MAG: hypothetical protein ACYC9L_05460 [Sulfuricaulis sp.]
MVLTGIWLVLAFAGVDKNGWWLLFWYTVFSGITQFPLALKAERAGMAAERTASLHAQMLRNQADTMQALLVLTRQIREAQLEETEED